MDRKKILKNGIVGLFILVVANGFQSAKAQVTDSLKNADSAIRVIERPTELNTSEHLNASNTSDNNQPVYKVNYWFSGIFSVVATAANLYAIPTFIHGKKDLTDAELAQLKTKTRNDINSFDRWALDLDPSQRDKFYSISDITLPSMVALSGASLLLDKRIRKDWKPIFMMYYEMHAATFTLYNYSPLGPTFVDKFRPIAYYSYFSDADRRAGNQKNSQYSGHVASTVASTFFAVKVYSDYHPEMGAKKYLYYTIAAIPPLVEGYFRIRALAHFPSDVAIGFGIGALTGILVPQLHKIKNRNVGVSLNTSPMGNPELGFHWNMRGAPKKLLNSFSNPTAFAKAGF